MLTTLSTLGCAHRTEPTAVCILILTVTPPSPTSATIQVGESFVGTAGAEWGPCNPKPPAHFRWKSSDSLTASVTPLDTMRATITGLRAGSGVVSPVYDFTGQTIAGINVVVQP